MRAIYGSGLPVVQVQPSEMSLSEAIMLGSVKHPQKFGGNYDRDSSGVVATCGLVAAVDALGLIDPAIKKKKLLIVDKVFPIVSEKVSGCPVCGKATVETGGAFFTQTIQLDRVGTVVMHLNDDHRWTRPQQAEWVKSIEAQIAARKQEQEAPSAVQTTQVR